MREEKEGNKYGVAERLEEFYVEERKDGHVEIPVVKNHIAPAEQNEDEQVHAEHEIVMDSG